MLQKKNLPESIFAEFLVLIAILLRAKFQFADTVIFSAMLLNIVLDAGYLSRMTFLTVY